MTGVKRRGKVNVAILSSVTLDIGEKCEMKSSHDPRTGSESTVIVT